MNRLLRLLAIAAAAATLLLASAPTDAAPTTHAKAAAPTTDDSFAYDVCTVMNPNRSGYANTNWSLTTYHANPEYINGVYHQDIRVWCRWVPFVSPNYGTLCRIADRHNNPTNATAPGEGWNWRVILDYYSC